MKIFMSSNNKMLKHYRVEFAEGENFMSPSEYQADDYTMDVQAMTKEDAALEVHFGLEYPENMQYRVCTIDPDTLDRTDNWEYFSFDSDITSASYTKRFQNDMEALSSGNVPRDLKKMPPFVLYQLLDIQDAIANGEASFSTITKDVADIMKKYGFKVTESGIGYKILF